MFGPGLSTYTLPGIVSPPSYHSQSGDLHLVTVDSADNLAGDRGLTVAGLRSRLTVNERDITALQTLTYSHTEQITDNTLAISQSQNTLIAHEAAIKDVRQQTGSNANEMELMRAGIDENVEQLVAMETTVAEHDT